MNATDKKKSHYCNRHGVRHIPVSGPDLFH